MNLRETSAEVVIIGGGVVGLSVARSLGLRGAGRIVLLERGSLGAESSSAAAGMLAPQAEADEPDYFFRFACESRDMYPEFAASLREETNIDIELDTSGTLYLAFTDHDVSEVGKRYQWQTEAGFEVEKFGPQEVRFFEPSVSPFVRAALKFPLDMQVENRRLISALASSNEQLGVVIETGVSALSINVEHGSITGVETSHGAVAAGNVVLAGGAWTSDLGFSSRTGSSSTAADIALPALRIEPVRGQMLCFESNPRICSHVIYSPRGYLVPRRDGRLLAGSTTEHVGFDKRVTAEGVHNIMTAALEISPRVGRLPMTDQWAGLRPRAADGLPVIGPCAEIGGLFYATGHYRNGILLAPITGSLIADAVMNKVASPSFDVFSPDRFGPVSAT